MGTALWATNNGDATLYTYGADPNNPFTWDGNRIHNCECDPGYSGYDCSVRTCPTGDDPGTYDDHNEVQLLKCVANGGRFTLSFRQAVTWPIPYNATAAQIKQALEALPTLSKLTVTFLKDGLPANGTLNFVKPELSPPQGMPPWARFTIVAAPENTVSGRIVDYIRVPLNTTKRATTACDPSGRQVIIVSFDTTHSNLPGLIVNNAQLTNNMNGLNGNPGTGIINVSWP